MKYSVKDISEMFRSLALLLLVLAILLVLVTAGIIDGKLLEQTNDALNGEITKPE